jgi:hypothetical protein
MREGKLKSGYGPYRARDLFQVPMNREDGPIWTFDRMGATRTELPDGRVVCIGGEHEDCYDPDFYIYNDVVVFQPGGEIKIYGYPRHVFPPTDFHTANLVGDNIIVVGCLGEVSDRRPGVTPIYSVDTNTFHITEVASSGAQPGWVFRHFADLSGESVVDVRGGQLVEVENGKQRFKRNIEKFSLDTASGAWTQTTNRNWPQWSVGREDRGLFVLDHSVRIRDLIPEGVERIAGTDESNCEARFLVRGVPVRVIAGVRWIEVVIEGELQEGLRHEVPEVFRRRVEVLCKKKCVVV